MKAAQNQITRPLCCRVPRPSTNGPPLQINFELLRYTLHTMKRKTAASRLAAPAWQMERKFPNSARPWKSRGFFKAMVVLMIPFWIFCWLLTFSGWRYVIRREEVDHDSDLVVDPSSEILIPEVTPKIFIFLSLFFFSSFFLACIHQQLSPVLLQRKTFLSFFLRGFPSVFFFANCGRDCLIW